MSIASEFFRDWKLSVGVSSIILVVGMMYKVYSERPEPLTEPSLFGYNDMVVIPLPLPSKFGEDYYVYSNIAKEEGSYLRYEIKLVFPEKVSKERIEAVATYYFKIMYKKLKTENCKLVVWCYPSREHADFGGFHMFTAYRVPGLFKPDPMEDVKLIWPWAGYSWYETNTSIVNGLSFEKRREIFALWAPIYYSDRPWSHEYGLSWQAKEYLEKDLIENLKNGFQRHYGINREQLNAIIREGDEFNWTWLTELKNRPEYLEYFGLE